MKATETINRVNRVNAEILGTSPIKSNACQECDIRFRCWTDMGILLEGEKVETMDTPLGYIGIKFTTKVLDCFPFDSIIGKRIVFSSGHQQTRACITSYSLHVSSNERLLEIRAEIEKYVR